MIAARFIPSHADIEAIARDVPAGYHLYSDGERSVIAREKPKSGLWAKVAVKIKTPTVAEVTPCAA